MLVLGVPVKEELVPVGGEQPLQRVPHRHPAEVGPGRSAPEAGTPVPWSPLLKHCIFHHHQNSQHSPCEGRLAAATLASSVLMDTCMTNKVWCILQDFLLPFYHLFMKIEVQLSDAAFGTLHHKKP